MQFQFNTQPFALTLTNGAKKSIIWRCMESKYSKTELMCPSVVHNGPKAFKSTFLINILQFKQFKVEVAALACSNNKNPAKKIAILWKFWQHQYHKLGRWVRAVPLYLFQTSGPKLHLSSGLCLAEHIEKLRKKKEKEGQ